MNFLRFPWVFDGGGKAGSEIREQQLLPGMWAIRWSSVRLFDQFILPCLRVFVRPSFPSPRVYFVKTPVPVPAHRLNRTLLVSPLNLGKLMLICIGPRRSFLLCIHMYVHDTYPLPLAHSNFKSLLYINFIERVEVCKLTVHFLPDPNVNGLWNFYKVSVNR